MKSNALFAVLVRQFLWHVSVACLIAVLQAFRCYINKVKPRLADCNSTHEYTYNQRDTWLNFKDEGVR